MIWFDSSKHLHRIVHARQTALITYDSLKKSTRFQSNIITISLFRVTHKLLFPLDMTEGDTFDGHLHDSVMKRLHLLQPSMTFSSFNMLICEVKDRNFSTVLSRIHGCREPS